MLSRDQVKALILSDDRDVRTAAMSYFADCASRDLDVFKTAIESTDLHDLWAEDENPLLHAGQLTFTNEMVYYAIELLETGQVPINTNSWLFLQSVLTFHGMEVWFADEQRIRAIPGIELITIQALGRRAKFWKLSADERCEYLYALRDRRAMEDASANERRDTSMMIAQSLVNSSRPSDEEVVQMLEAVPVEAACEVDLALMVIAGYRKLLAARPALCKFLGAEVDAFATQAAAALVLQEQTDLPQMLFDMIPEQGWHFKLNALGCIISSKSPDAEAMLLQLLDKERDRDTRAYICHGLVSLFSDKAFEPATKFLESGHWSSIGDMGHRLIVLAKVLGIQDHPDEKTWYAKSDEYRLHLNREQDKARKREAMQQLSNYTGTQDDSHTHSHDHDHEHCDHPSHNHDHAHAHTAGKVGRNDPCPCGSGRKYKKCCGR